VERYSIPPKNLRIEITETAMMTDSEEKMKIFESFRQEGFIVEMDDFGSGYSSLNMLKDMPVDVLKIDMQFLSGGADKKSRTVLKNVINLSKELDMMALTEGVETKQQFDQLIIMGCSLFQGYYFAKPMMEEEFEAFIDQEETKYEKHQN
jgi:EAL domain-containing protein (putative c-di-GMP-specific phosphodiesterase class I)